MCAHAHTSAADRQGKPEKSGTRTGKDNKRENLVQPVSTFSSCFVSVDFTVQVTRWLGYKFDTCARGTVGCGCRGGLKEPGCWWRTAPAIPDTLLDLKVGATPFPPWPVICMCGRAVEQRATLCRANSGPFVGASYATRGTVMTSWKESKVLVQITSFTLSCELPAACENTTDKLYRKGLLFLAFHRSAFVDLLCSGYFCRNKSRKSDGKHN